MPIKNGRTSGIFIAEMDSWRNLSSETNLAPTEHATSGSPKSIEPTAQDGWMEMTKKLLDQLHHTSIVNADETLWCVDPLGVILWAKRRRLNCAAYMKSLFSALAHGKLHG
jgi:hypothetical protein